MRKAFFIMLVSVLLFLTACGGSSENVSGDSSSASSSENESDNETIKIGVLAPLSGFVSNHGEAIKLSSELTAEMINEEGGILGKDIEVIIEDTQSEPSVAAEKAKQLINKDEVDFLIGTASSAETLGVVPIAEESGVPFIYGLEGEVKTCSPTNINETAKYVFGAGPSELMLLDKFIPAMLEKYGDSVYFVGSDYVFPHSVNSIAADIVKENGGNVLGMEFAPTDTTDYSSIINNINKAEPDILFLTVPGTAGVTFMKQAHQFGILDQMAVTGLATFDIESFSEIGELSKGVIVVNRYSELLDNPENKKFVDAYKAKYNPNYPIGTTAAAGTYGVIRTMQAAIEQAGTTDADSVVEALKGLKLDLPQGEIEVNPENNIFNQRIYMLEITDDNYEVIEDLGFAEHPGLEGCVVGQ